MTALRPRPHRRRTSGSTPAGRRLLLTTAALTLAAGTVQAAALPAAHAATTTTEVSSWSAQTITGIGASGAWWTNDLVNFSASAQQQVADLLFSPSGIQLSTYRYNIGGGGAGVIAANYDRAPQSLMTGVGTYDWNRDPGGTAFLRAASAAGVPKIIGFANSAPSQFTTNGRNCGGSLTSGQEQAYATYLADVVAHFRSVGVNISTLSPMNEPDDSFSACTQEGMSVGTGQRATIVNTLASTLSARGLSSVAISADELSQVGQVLGEWPSWVPSASGNVGTLAHHTYDYPTDAALTDLQSMGRRFGKATWASEICCQTSANGGFGQQYDPTIAGGLGLSGIIYRDFAVAGDSEFHWWTALSKVLGCDPASSAGCATSVNTTGWNDGLIYYDPNYAGNGNQNLYPSKRFYVLGQYSRFVRPGAVRFPVTGAPGGVQVLATSASGRWTLVVTNTNTSAQTFGVHFNALNQISAASAYRTSATENIASVGLPPVSGATATLSLPARSVTTYVFTQNGGPAVRTGASPLVGTQSGRCVDVPGAATANGTRIELYDCNGGSNQAITYTAASELRVLGKCLDAYNQGTANGTAIDLYDCNGGINQKWTLAANGEIRGVQSGRCLDATGQGTANGTLLELYDCNGGANQAWRRPN
ncbi:MAG TPA: glycoside hydrolase [Kineosporiaceae bacterium]|nr:glycoside hydrolase [Kineosporiaceae bacterium]